MRSSAFAAAPERGPGENRNGRNPAGGESENREARDTYLFRMDANDLERVEQLDGDTVTESDNTADACGVGRLVMEISRGFEEALSKSFGGYWAVTVHTIRGAGSVEENPCYGRPDVRGNTGGSSYPQFMRIEVQRPRDVRRLDPGEMAGAIYGLSFSGEVYDEVLLRIDPLRASRGGETPCEGSSWGEPVEPPVTDTVHDPYWSSQWGHIRVGAEGAWCVTRGRSDVLIAIIDTGCDLDHPDIRDRLWTNTAESAGEAGIDDDGNGYTDDVHGWDFVTAGPSDVADGEDPAPQDCRPDDFLGHGTHVAGIVAAESGNGIGVEGAAPECRLMILRAGYAIDGAVGAVREGDAVEAVYYAIDMGADVINMSFAGEGSFLMQRAMEEARDAGVVLVASAGNGGGCEPRYPAAYDQVLAVAAADRGDGLAAFSGFGGWIACSAPGVSILSAVPGDYAYKSGTSMAAPFVTAAAALVKSVNPSWGPSRIEAQVIYTCDEAGGAPDPEAGTFRAGMVRLDRAVSIRPEYLFEVTSVSVCDGGGDGDGAVDAGERASISVKMENAWRPFPGGYATLSCAEEAVRIMDGGPATLGHLAAGECAEMQFEIECAGWFDDERTAEFELSVFCTGPESSCRFSLMLNRRVDLFARRIIADEIEGDGDGGMDHGERIRLRVEVVNGGVFCEGVSARLDVPPGVGVVEGERVDHIGDMEEGASVWAEYMLDVNGGADGGGEVRVPLWLSSRGDSLEETISIWVSYEGEDGCLEAPDMLQGNAGHSGEYDTSCPAALGLKWVSVFDGAGSHRCQPIVREGTVFTLRVENGVRVVYAMDANEGGIEWVTALPGSAEKGPMSAAWYRGIFYAGGGEWCHALNGGNGRTVWTFSPEVSFGAGEYRLGNPTVYMGSIFLQIQEFSAGGEDRLCALDPFTGKLLWAVGGDHGSYGAADAPAAGCGMVFKADWGGLLAAHDARTGDSVWRRNISGIPGAPVLFDAGKVVVALTNGTVRAFDARGGDELWSTDTTGEPRGAMCAFTYPAPGLDAGAGERANACCTEREQNVASNSGGRAVCITVRGPAGDAVLTLDGDDGDVITSAEIPSMGIGGVVHAGGAVIAGGGAGEMAVVRFENGGAVAESTRMGDWGRGPVMLGLPVPFGDEVFVALEGNEADGLAAFGPRVDAGDVTPLTLHQNFPNPFNPGTEVSFVLPEGAAVNIAVYDVAGRLVKVLIDEPLCEGPHGVWWDGRNGAGWRVSPGIYFCVMRAGSAVRTRKLVLVR